jgi:hypothetical protein
MKAPTSNIQHPEKLQTPSSNGCIERLAGLKFEDWSFSGAWCLVLGAFRKDFR